MQNMRRRVILDDELSDDEGDATQNVLEGSKSSSKTPSTGMRSPLAEMQLHTTIPSPMSDTFPGFAPHIPPASTPLPTSDQQQHDLTELLRSACTITPAPNSTSRLQQAVDAIHAAASPSGMMTTGMRSQHRRVILSSSDEEEEEEEDVPRTGMRGPGANRVIVIDSDEDEFPIQRQQSSSVIVIDSEEEEDEDGEEDEKEEEEEDDEPRRRTSQRVQTKKQERAAIFKAKASAYLDLEAENDDPDNDEEEEEEDGSETSLSGFLVDDDASLSEYSSDASWREEESSNDDEEEEESPKPRRKATVVVVDDEENEEEDEEEQVVTISSDSDSENRDPAITTDALVDRILADIHAKRNNNPPPHPKPKAATLRPVTPHSFAAFKRRRNEYTASLYLEFNSNIFSNRLPSNLDIQWSGRLLTTAGVTHYKREVLTGSDLFSEPSYSARIELSSKVLDTYDKLRRTLCHEMCHVAAFLLDHVSKPPHGTIFKKWADLAMRRYEDLEVTTCHKYEIHYAHKWQCTVCDKEYGRHSNSLDVTKKACGVCRGTLRYLGRQNQDGTPARPKVQSAYNKFVAEHYPRLAKELGAQVGRGELMKRVAALYQEHKQSIGGGEGTSGSMLDHAFATVEIDD